MKFFVFLLTVLVAQTSLANPSTLKVLKEVVASKKLEKAVIAENQKGFIFHSLSNTPMDYELKLVSNDPFEDPTYRCTYIEISPFTPGSPEIRGIHFGDFEDCN